MTPTGGITWPTPTGAATRDTSVGETGGNAGTGGQVVRTSNWLPWTTSGTLVLALAGISVGVLIKERHD